MSCALPQALIGVLMAAYWGRVLRLVYKAKQTTGRGANFVPTETLGRFLRLIWNPVVALWIALPLVTAFAKGLPAGFRPLYCNEFVAWGAMTVAAAAFLATLVCWKKMGKSWRMGIDPGETTQLVLSGPYAYVRHPIYALSSLLMVCTMIIVPSIAMIVTGVVHLMLLQWEARREERYLAALHGEPYQRYVARVGRFVPVSAKAYHGQGGAE
jgi:protein-S-isoprenylcysteine O-methyltransferase Ste14